MTLIKSKQTYLSLNCYILYANIMSKTITIKWRFNCWFSEW